MRRDKWQEEKKQDNIFAKAVKAVVKTATPILVSGVIVVSSALGFVGCEKTPQGPSNEPIVNTTNNNTNQNNNENQNQGNQTPQTPGSENQTSQTPQTPVGKTEQELLAEKSAVWSTFLTSIAGGNYKVNITSGNVSYEYSVDDNSVVKEVAGTTTTYYVFDATNGNYLLTSTDGTTFSKQNTTIADAGDFFYDTISGATVTALGDNGSFVVTTAGGTQYSASHDASGNLVLTSTNATAKVSDIGQIALTVPEIASENIYEVDAQGNKIFNCALIGEVVENWLKGDNQYGEDFLSYRYKVALGNSYDETVMPTTDKILYIKASEDYIGIVILSDHKIAGKQISERYFNLSSFYSALKNGSLQTADELKNYLNTNKDLILGKNVVNNIDYTTLDDDYAIAHKTQFEALTESVFNRIETVGTHSYKDTVNANSTMSGFSDGTILFAYKTTPTATGAGGGLGQYQSWNQCYLIERNGNLELIKFNIWSSTYNGVSNCYENVLSSNANNQSFWYLGNVTIVDEIDETNINLLNNKNNSGKILEN